MGVTTSLYLVDWQRLTDGFAEHGTPDFFYQALEDDEPWLSSPEAEYVESWRWAQDLGEAYDKARPHLEPDVEEPLSEFLWGLGVVRHDGPEVTTFPTVKDLDVSEEAWDLHFLSLDPRSVDRFLELAARLPEDGVRNALVAAWGAAPAPPPPKPRHQRMDEMRAALAKIRQTKPEDAATLDRIFARAAQGRPSPPATKPIDDPDTNSKLLGMLVASYRDLLEEARRDGRGLIAYAA